MITRGEEMLALISIITERDHMGRMSEEYLAALANAGAGDRRHHGAYPGATARYVPNDVAETIMNAFNAQPREVPNTFFVCAEPGMDVDETLDYVASVTRSASTRVCSLDLRGSSDGEAVRKFVNFARVAVKNSATKRVLAVCKGLPPADESELQRELSAIRRMREAGCFVVIGMLPEALQLSEGLPEATCYRTRDLLMGLPKRLRRTNGLARDMIVATHGIPLLVRTVSKVRSRDLGHVASDPGYVENLGLLVAETLRDTLMDEEREVRCALLLLGDGTIEDLRRVLRRCDDEILASVSSNSPVCGLKLPEGGFRCVATDTYEGLSAVYGSLSPVASEFPGTVAAVAEVLAERGEWNRSAVVCNMAPDGLRQTTLAIMNASEFIDVGEASLVADAVERASQFGLGIATQTREAKRALRLLRQDCGSVRCPAEGSACSGVANGLAWPDYMEEVRALCRGIGVASPIPPSRQPRGTEAALSHMAESLRLLLGGRFPDAFGEALKARSLLADRDGSLLSALLSDVYYLSTGMSGAMPTEEEAAWHEASAQTLEGRSPLLASLHKAVPTVVGIMMGRDVDNGDVEALARLLERSGDAMLKAVACVALTVSDLRRGAVIRAGVRLNQVRETLARLGDPSPYLQESCRILGALIEAEEGGPLGVDLKECEGGSRELDQVCELLIDAVGARSVSRAPAAATPPRVPSGAAWLVNLLLNDFGRLSERFSAAVPPGWSRELAQMGAVATVASDQSERSVDEALEGLLEPLDEACEVDEDHALKISLLGRLSVSVAGEGVPAASFERRRAKELLVLLAAAPQHQVKRYKIMESVWPDADYVAGQQRVYEATSVLRHVMGGRVGTRGEGPLLTNRTERTLSLNPKCVIVDVDGFERVARKALDGEGDNRLVLAAARRAETIYQGDLFVPANDGIGLVEQRRRELRRLYADVMVAGTLAALRVCRTLTAARFARNAYEADGMREDAIKLLVATLVATGRVSEAEKEYKVFCNRVVERTHRPPSRDLRDAVSKLLSGGRPSVLGIVEPETEVSDDARSEGDEGACPDAVGVEEESGAASAVAEEDGSGEAGSEAFAPDGVAAPGEAAVPGEGGDGYEEAQEEGAEPCEGAPDEGSGHHGDDACEDEPGSEEDGEAMGAPDDGAEG